MIKTIYKWFMYGGPLPHLFANERLVSDVPFRPKKQDPEHHPSWIMKSDPVEAKVARHRWMVKHYGGETHPADL